MHGAFRQGKLPFTENQLARLLGLDPSFKTMALVAGLPIPSTVVLIFKTLNCLGLDYLKDSSSRKQPAKVRFASEACPFRSEVRLR